MNSGQDGTETGVTDQIVSEWLDGPSVEVPSALKLSNVAINRNRVADLLWLHSLLEVALRPDPVRQSQRIERVIAAIRQQSATVEQLRPESTVVTESHSIQPQRPRRRRQSVAWTAAAVLVICAGLWMQIATPRQQVHAAVEQMRQATLQAEDREYLVTLSFSETDPQHSDRNVEATLFVRGGEAFVVKAPAVLRRGEIWFGRDRDAVWFKPAGGSMLFGPGALALQQRFVRGTGNESPFLQITTVIDRLADNYELELLASEIPPQGVLSSVPVCRHVHGIRHVAASTPSWLPERVDIHADQRSGTIMRLELAWDQAAPSHLKQVRFDFVGQSKKPDGWYRGDFSPD